MTTKIVHEKQFSLELGRIEPRQEHQGRVLEMAEQACRDRSRHGEGYGFARIQWKRKLLIWYHATDGEVVLLSIRQDLT